MLYALCHEDFIVCDNRRKSAVKYLLFIVATSGELIANVAQYSVLVTQY